MMMMPSKFASKLLKKKCQKKYNFFFDLASVPMLAEYDNSTENQPQSLNEAWNHPNMEPQRMLQEDI